MSGHNEEPKKVKRVDVTSWAIRRGPEYANAYAEDTGMQRFWHLPTEIWAKKMDVPFKVDTGHGVATGEVGDYLCMDIEGGLYPCKREVFESTYKAKEPFDPHKTVVGMRLDGGLWD